jgi:hypothetical protein
MRRGLDNNTYLIGRHDVNCKATFDSPGPRHGEGHAMEIEKDAIYRRGLPLPTNKPP